MAVEGIRRRGRYDYGFRPCPLPKPFPRPKPPLTPPILADEAGRTLTTEDGLLILV